MPRVLATCGRLREMDRHATNGRSMSDAQRRREGIIFLILFALTVPAANWLVGNVGTRCVPNGPCLIPVAPELMAPSGVLMIGIALVLRDLMQRRLGVRVATAAILAGSALSGLLAPPALVIASAAAFLLSELADLAVYTPLARRGLVAAVVASSLVGLVVDSIVFSVARLRLARFSRRPGHRQGLDGPAVDSVRVLAAPPRGAGWRGSGLAYGWSMSFPETGVHRVKSGPGSSAPCSRRLRYRPPTRRSHAAGGERLSRHVVRLPGQRSRKRSIKSGKIRPLSVPFRN